VSRPKVSDIHLRTSNGVKIQTIDLSEHKRIIAELKEKMMKWHKSQTGYYDECGKKKGSDRCCGCGAVMFCKRGQWICPNKLKDEWARDNF
jgi:hypothetical protein